jgi:hypothetical protein
MSTAARILGRSKETMIVARLELPPLSGKQLIEALLAMPEELRPTHYREGEESKRTPIDPQKLIARVTSPEVTGFFLGNRKADYDLSFYGPRIPMVCYADLNLSPRLAWAFMMHMAQLQPVFGHACANEEEEYRNRVFKKLSTMSSESWVGRDLNKYVPGLYWLTLLPVQLAKRHGVPLDALEQAAIEHLEPAPGQHLFRFYDDPEDWRTATAIHALCTALPGIFDSEKFMAELELVHFFLDLRTVLN